jgi:hypothetical protein
MLPQEGENIVMGERATVGMHEGIVTDRQHDVIMRTVRTVYTFTVYTDEL